MQLGPIMKKPCDIDYNQNVGIFRDKLRDAHCRELVFAIVGQAGSGTSEVARQLEVALDGSTIANNQREKKCCDKERSSYRASIMKASSVIRDQQHSAETATDHKVNKLHDAEKLQNLGDDLRKADGSKIAQLILHQMLNNRSPRNRRPPQAWIIDSLRHPEEVRFLRSVYGDNFFLVGVVCSHEERRRRLLQKFSGALPEAIDNFMQRDEGDEQNRTGQQVAKAFQLSDVYIDNTDVKELSDQPNASWRVPEDLRRFIDLILQTKIIPPTMEETAMHAAYGSAMRSACLSRQVGAALVDKDGRLLATGCNDVPKPGGGLYGQSLGSSQFADHRCFAFPGKEAYCRNNREQQEMIVDIAEKLINKFSSYFLNDRESSSSKRSALIRELQNSRITTLTEFSRAIHAEMDALLAAARQGISPVGASLFVTTFPCHNCARHIVVAGIREVQYIEPYRKSQATKLHEDAITISAREAEAGNKVLFRPFTGIAPRRYRQLFYNERDLKDGTSGDRARPILPPPWGRPGQHIEAVRDTSEKFAADRINGGTKRGKSRSGSRLNGQRSGKKKSGMNGTSKEAPSSNS